MDHYSRTASDLSEEDISSSEAGRHCGVVPLQRKVDGPVDQLRVFGVVVLQHHGCLKLLCVFAQQQACCHGSRAHCHLAESVQQTHLTREDDDGDFIDNLDCVSDLHAHKEVPMIVLSD